MVCGNRGTRGTLQIYSAGHLNSGISAQQVNMIKLVTWTSLQLEPSRLKKEKRLKVHLCRHSSFKLCASQKVTFPGIDSVVFQMIQIVVDYTWLAFVTSCSVIYFTQSDTVQSFGYIRKVRGDDEKFVQFDSSLFKWTQHIEYFQLLFMLLTSLMQQNMHFSFTST